MILTAALELSRNQVTHFYSHAKNTEEMIKMADLLRTEYCTAARSIYRGMQPRGTSRRSCSLT